MTGSALYTGEVYHRRKRPREHSLRYRVFTLLLNLDEIPDIASSLWLFSHNRWNLLGFHDKDFGEDQQEPLRDYIERLLQENNIKEYPDTIMLSCYPRVLGYVFNPLSLFYCIDAKGHLFAVVHEVHNTLGERHAYVLPVLPDTQEWIHQRAVKELFVSPFAQMNMHYDFRLNLPDEKQVIIIRASDEDGVLITASYKASKQSLTAATLMREFFRIPLMSFKVIIAIHWEALRLWIKRVPWFSHQPKRINKKQKNHA